MENIGISLANFLGGGSMLLIGLALKFVKGAENMVAGYNTMKKTEQEKWNAVKMRVSLGKTFILASCLLLVSGILALLNIYRMCRKAPCFSYGDIRHEFSEKIQNSHCII
jgi:hypothetical protein